MKKLLFAITLAATTAMFVEAQNLEVELQRAVQNETVTGDLSAAIKAYQGIVDRAGSDKKIAADALIRMADVYQKQGDAKAREIYEHVVNEFADQAESVTTAQARLAALRTPEPDSMTLRKVWDGGAADISPDGRFVTDVVNWPNGIVVRDVETGATRVVTGPFDEASGGYIDTNRISPDGRTVAYVWVVLPDEFQVRLVPIDGSAQTRIVYRSTNYFSIAEWSPDGQSLLLSRGLGDGAWQLAMLSVRDGSIRQIKSFNWGNPGARISPDGSYIAYSLPVGNGLNRDIRIVATDGSQDTAVVEHPANDSSVVWSPDGSRLLFVSNRTATPSLWSIPVSDGKPAGAAELVKSDVGRIELMRMAHSGTLYYRLAGASRSEVYSAPLGEDGRVSGTPEAVADQYVNTNWGGTLSPDGKQIAYYSDRRDTVLVVRSLVSGQERVYPLDFELVRQYFLGPSWHPDGRSVFVVKRGDQDRPDSLLLRLDLATGNAEEAGPQPGLNLKASPKDASLFYANNGSRRLSSLDLETGRETLIRAPTEGRVGNPAVSPDGRQIAYVRRPYADRGEISVEVMDLPDGDPRVVFQTSPRNFRIAPDLFNTLGWTPDKRYLLLVRLDQQDGEVVSPRMYTIWRIPVAGGEAERIGISMNARIKAPQVSPDGKTIFFSAADTGSSEVWALENFLPEQTAAR